MDGYDSETGEILPVAADAGRAPPKPMPPAIAAAIINVMQRAKQLGFDEKNQHGGYSYVSIDKFLEAFRPLLASAGLMIVVDEIEIGYRDGAPGKDGKITPWAMPVYDVWLYHESGAGWGPLRRHLALPMTGPQTFGAAESYVQKRLLRALFMVPTGEKDADSVEQGDAPPARQATRATPVAQQPSTGEAASARKTVQEIRQEISDAETIEQLNQTGLFSIALKALVERQKGGDVVWADLVDRDARRRMAMIPDARVQE